MSDKIPADRGRIEESSAKRKETKSRREKKVKLCETRQLEKSEKMCHSYQKVKVKSVMGKK